MIVIVLVAIGLVAWGIVGRVRAVANLRDVAREDVGTGRAGYRASAWPAVALAVIAWHDPRLVCSADLRAGVRLCPTLVQGLRRHGEDGRPARDDRRARPGRTIRDRQGQTLRSSRPNTNSPPLPPSVGVPCPARRRFRSRRSMSRRPVPSPSWPRCRRQSMNSRDTKRWKVSRMWWPRLTAWSLRATLMSALM